ncbi:MFS general substrate transporter [Wolfiporia cocos MD-104 SS10]|uniref:MFS general substrate transporter n=1 Tax=Wolfiporia cocos (strain MD-104) TaxID=742152 RepID=A0A2H3JNW7_WOLCO|nr:MFS general substrate transporter [Wolfiporia cocos MD-104 SS10]
MDTPRSEKTHVDIAPADLNAVNQSKYSKEEDARSPSISYIEPPNGDNFEADEYLDGGRGWLVVAGCVIYAAATLGWSYLHCLILMLWQAWGVVQTYYQEHLFPNTSGTILSLLGSISGMPFLALGGVFWLAGMLGSAFCTELWQFFITQGFLQGIANAFIFPLVVALPSQWFLKHRAFATGTVVGGCSLGGAVASLMMYKMLAVLGYKKTFAIYSAIDGACFVLALMLIKERRPASKRPKIVWFDRTFFTDPVFWSLGTCCLCTVFGYLSPIFFLPTYTLDKLPHLSDFLSTLPLTLLNLSAATGRTSVGFIADRIGPVNALWISITMSGLTQLLLWNFVHTYAGIIAFGIIYGFFCGCFISLSPAVAAQLYGADRLAGLSGLLLMFNLPGNAAGAPIGGAILQRSGGNWQAMACYSGAMQIAGAILLLYARFKKQPKLIAKY